MFSGECPVRTRAFIPTVGLALGMALALGACLAADNQEALDYDPGPPPPAPAPVSNCEVDADCRLAAAGCCECASFALSDDRAEDACTGVICEDELTCPAVAAVCDTGACVIQCQPVVCGLTCPGGFIEDTAGCLLCACAAPPPPGTAECVDATDCERVPADCCGCARGGRDTAIPSVDVEAYLAALDCPESPACPELDACEPDAEASCVANQCALLGAGIDGPPDGAGSGQWCGSPELGPCPDGTFCVLNAPQANDATQSGVGICQSA